MGKKIKRLFFDIETSPNIGFFWSSGYKLSIGPENIIKERAIICICYKWEGDPRVYSLQWDRGDDKKMLIEFAKVMKQADEVVGHNGDNYDIKWFRTRCIYHGIPTLPEFQSLDTLKLARKGFRFNSNKLDYIARFLGIGQKMSTGGFDLWKNIVLTNDPSSLDKMVRYCKKDVQLLEKVYHRLEPYTKHKTHAGVLSGGEKCDCPSCASKKTISDGNMVSAAGLIKKRMVCKDCNKYFTVAESVYLASRS